MAIHAALILSLIGSLALAWVLLVWADAVAGARLLVAFLTGVAVWIVGNELPSWAGAELARPALMLMATASLTSAVFLHFALAFCGVAASRAWLGLIYGIGLAATLLSVAVPAGSFAPFAGVALMAMPNAVGWVTSFVWAALAAIGQIVLLRALVRAPGLEKHRIGAVMAASGWGLACMSGYGVAALHLQVYPWPLLGLPLYPVILVYGILRYRVLVANAWARRALAWALLVGLAGLLAAAAGAMAPRAGLGAWAGGAVAACAVLVLGGPMRRIAESIVYPGAAVTAEDMRVWRADLGQAGTPDALAARAASILSRQLGMNVAVRIGGSGKMDVRDAGLACRLRDGVWQTEAAGWSAAPPGSRRVASLFGDVLAAQAERVAGLEASRAAERALQTQARLAELGSLAATVAHDVRNPLNIIGMAVAGAEAETRGEVSIQIARIARLADDLLDFAKPWEIVPETLDLASIVAEAARHRAGVALGPALAAPLLASGDPIRLEQAIGNLLDNALAAGGRVLVDADCVAGAIRLYVCDDGPGIPEEIRDRLFAPFVSRRAGGTGLGLAIVAKVMAAHGGTASITCRPPWTTCFTLEWPHLRAVTRS